MYEQSAHLLGTVGRPREGTSRDRAFLLRGSALALRVAVAGLLVVIGIIHLHLWLEGYRFIPTNGPLFLADAIAAFALAGALLVAPRAMIGLAAAGFSASTLGALVISLSVGLFGFKEALGASYVVLSIALETIACVGAIAWTALIWSGAGRGRATGP